MPSPDSPRRGLRTAWICALLFCGTVLLFSRATRCGFINYDDPLYVTDNPHVQAGLSWDGIVWAFTAPADYWHPLTWLDHMLDWQLYGRSASGHHLTSVLWHALNAVLAFLVFRRLAGRFWLSAFAAALFAWHPLRVESVVWISERKDVMSGCFFLLTLLAYARYVGRLRAGGPWRRSYLLALGCFAAGLMSKPMLVTLPVVLLILDFWPWVRFSSLADLRPLLIEKAPFFALSGVTAVLTVLMQRQAGAFVLDMPWCAGGGNAMVSLARYLGKFFWPADLIVCYSHPGYWPVPGVLSASALALGLGWLSWRQRRSRPWILAGWLWYVVVLLPVLGLVQVGFQAMADRYSYLPLLGVELALLWSLPALNSRAKRAAATFLAVVLLAACAVRTWEQEGVWRDSVSLFEHAVQASDRNYVAEDLLASALSGAGRSGEAAVHAERALALNPRDDRALVTLAGLSERKGRIDAAAALYRSALALRPGAPPVQCQLGLLELSRGHPGEARALMIPALRSTSDLRSRTLQIGRNALEQGDAAKALFLFQLVLAAAPDNTEAHVGAGLALLARHDAAGAIVPLQAAVARAPASAEAELALADCAEQLGRTAEALTALSRAEAAAPDNPAVLSRAADFHARLREFAAATRLYRRVVKLAPADSGAHIALGFLLIQAGDRAGGIAQWRRALELNPNIPGLRDRLLQEER